jgi:hypothetical protein
MIIKLPDNFCPERNYVIDIVFKEFLGLKYTTETYNGQDYEIILENKNTLIVEDHFFSNINETYLKQKNIPLKIEFCKNQFIPENDIPVIYGNDRILAADNKIFLGIDIFASIFFMLTRFEEYIERARDPFDRFSAKDSLAFKNNFLHRPVVNEYIEMLWNILKLLDIKQERKKHDFKMVLTHDVDQPLWSARSIAKRTVKDILQKKSSSGILENVKTHFKSKYDITYDPYNNYDFLLDLSEKYNTQSHFFFSAAKKSEFDIGYNINSKFIQRLIIEISIRNHIIGIHPGFFSYNDDLTWKNEYKKLQNNIPLQISCGRQHYLRFDVPSTWQIWDDNKMEWDSTLTYFDKEGFRCGTCFEFSVFNILTRKKLSLKEKPLIVMEGSFFHYQNIKSDEIVSKILSLKNTTKKYSGNFVLLWHNSSFNVEGFEDAKSIYEEVLKG